MTTPTSNNNVIRLNEHYTGTQDAPDSVSIFYKQEDGNIKFFNEEIKNSLGHSPLLGMAYALPRIDRAVKQILQGGDLLNAVKNLIRGFIQPVPLLGNATLYVFDYVRTNLYFHSKIKAALAEQNGPIMGIAFDGKIVGQFSKTQMEKAFNKNNREAIKDHLAILGFSWFSVLGGAYKKDPQDLLPPTRLQLANSFVEEIKNATFL